VTTVLNERADAYAPLWWDSAMLAERKWGRVNGDKSHYRLQDREAACFRYENHQPS
jgi:hypothetical protein